MEIKLTSRLATEATRFRTAGRRINEGYKKVSVNGASDMKTAVEYENMCELMKELLEQYIELVDKDVADIQQMYQSVKNQDVRMSKIFK